MSNTSTNPDLVKLTRDIVGQFFTNKENQPLIHKNSGGGGGGANANIGTTTGFPAAGVSSRKAKSKNGNNNKSSSTQSKPNIKSPIVRRPLAQDDYRTRFVGPTKVAYEQNDERKKLKFDKQVHILEFNKRNLVTRVGDAIQNFKDETFRPNRIASETALADRNPGQGIIKYGTKYLSRKRRATYKIKARPRKRVRKH